MVPTKLQLDDWKACWDGNVISTASLIQCSLSHEATTSLDNRPQFKVVQGIVHDAQVLG